MDIYGYLPSYKNGGSFHFANGRHVWWKSPVLENWALTWFFAAQPPTIQTYLVGR